MIIFISHLKLVLVGPSICINVLVTHGYNFTGRYPLSGWPSMLRSEADLTHLLLKLLMASEKPIFFVRHSAGIRRCFYEIVRRCYMASCSLFPTSSRSRAHLPESARVAQHRSGEPLLPGHPVTGPGAAGLVMDMCYDDYGWWMFPLHHVTHLRINNQSINPQKGHIQTVTMKGRLNPNIDSTWMFSVYHIGWNSGPPLWEVLIDPALTEGRTPKVSCPRRASSWVRNSCGTFWTVQRLLSV